jgi:hypothetical protein
MFGSNRKALQIRLLATDLSEIHVRAYPVIENDIDTGIHAVEHQKQSNTITSDRHNKNSPRQRQRGVAPR